MPTPAGSRRRRRSHFQFQPRHSHEMWPPMNAITVDGLAQDTRPGERLIDVIMRAGIDLPAVCYHPQLGPLQTCDTCLVEVDGKLVRACATAVTERMQVLTKSA